MTNFNERKVNIDPILKDRLTALFDEERVNRWLPIARNMLSELAPELESSLILQVIESTVVSQAPVSFEDARLGVDGYLSKYFQSYLDNGFLPISQVEDTSFRKRLSVEISRGGLNDDFRVACFTRQQLLEYKRHLVRQIAQINKESLNTFARSLLSREKM